MAEHVLVPMDGSPQARTALEYAIGEHPDAEITVLHVINPIEAGFTADPMGGDFWEGWYDYAEEAAEGIFEDAREVAGEHGVEVGTAREMGRPAHTIIEYAEEHGVDGIVMGSHGRSGVARVLLGSVAETVVRRAPIPVTVVR